jgi:hypothetical protein
MGAAGKLLLLSMAVMSNAAPKESEGYTRQMKLAVNSLNKLLDYMLEPRSVIGDMIFGVVLARGKHVEVCAVGTQ